MKKILALVLVVLFIASSVSATVVATRVSGSTTQWGKDASGPNATSSVITFSSVTSRIVLQNLSRTRDCWVDIKCVNNPTGTTGHLTTNSAVVLLPMLGRATPNVVQIDFATRNLGFLAKDMTVGGVYNDEQVVYYVLGEAGDL